jgi:hypothetical protein
MLFDFQKVLIIHRLLAKRSITAFVVPETEGV